MILHPLVKGDVQNCVRRGAAAAPCSSSRGIYLYIVPWFALLPLSHHRSLPFIRPSSSSSSKTHKSPQKTTHLAARLRLRLPRTIHVRDLGNELGREDVDLLVGAVQQAQRSDLVGRGRVVSGGFGFLAAVGGLESCDFGGLSVRQNMHS
jgi:hypothetical protein